MEREKKRDGGRGANEGSFSRHSQAPIGAAQQSLPQMLNVIKTEIIATSIAITSHFYYVNVPFITLSRRLRHSRSIAPRADANRRTWTWHHSFRISLALYTEASPNPCPPNEIRRRRAASMSNTLYHFISTSAVIFGTSL